MEASGKWLDANESRTRISEESGGAGFDLKGSHANFALSSANAHQCACSCETFRRLRCLLRFSPAEVGEGFVV